MIEDYYRWMDWDRRPACRVQARLGELGLAGLVDEFGGR